MFSSFNVVMEQGKDFLGELMTDNNDNNDNNNNNVNAVKTQKSVRCMLDVWGLDLRGEVFTERKHLNSWIQPCNQKIPGDQNSFSPTDYHYKRHIYKTLDR